MTVKLSPQKVAKILRYYFSGLPQMKIAKKSGVDQSSISIYATRFKERVSEVRIISAGKEYGLMEEVDALRSLSVELHKAKLTVDEAKEGVKVEKAFIKLGISPAINKLREAEIHINQGIFVSEASRKIGVTQQTYYRWRKEYGGLRIEQAKRLKSLEKENTRLKKLVEFWPGEIIGNLAKATDDERARFAEMFDLYAIIRPDGHPEGYHAYNYSISFPFSCLMILKV